MERLILASSGLYPPSKRADMVTRKLAMGILLQALRDAAASTASASKEKRYWRKDALEWFASEDPGPGSLDWVCSILEIEAGALRRLMASPSLDSGPLRRSSLLLNLAHGL